MIDVAILNVTGYAGAELARLLSHHPDVRIVAVTGRSAAGKRLGEVFPHLARLDLAIETETERGDLAFSALPHAAAAETLLPFVRRGVPVIDLSADFRLRDAAVYERWYRHAHVAPELLDRAVYGMPELHRDAIRTAGIIACPGCYPTAAILAVAPAVRAGLVNGDVIVDAKSGISGAGRGLGLTYHFAEANESVSAYALDGHRHLPEISQELAALREGVAPAVTFVPHLVPMTRGILATCYAPLADGLRGRDDAASVLRAAYERAYTTEPFTHLVETPPATKHTLGTNDCLVHVTVDPERRRMVAVAAVDNLVKGAAGQGVQCMNIRLGLPETRGLEAAALYP